MIRPPRHPGFREGDFASGGYGWQTHSVVNGDALTKLDPAADGADACSGEAHADGANARDRETGADRGAGAQHQSACCVR
jgi:hypothetical protein